MYGLGAFIETWRKTFCGLPTINTNITPELDSYLEGIARGGPDWHGPVNNFASLEMCLFLIIRGRKYHFGRQLQQGII